MRYDSYESKIVKIAKFFKLIFKHRVKIIISTAIVFTVTAALLATRGIIVNAKDCPDEIVYGEKLDYSAGAFISKTSYEYSSDGDTWTTEHPIRPGDYYVRAAAKATFGMRYGDPQPFRIVKKPIELKIANTNVQYGDLPSLTAAFAYSDSVVCEAFIYGDADEAGRRNVIADMTRTKIVNKKGEDVTSCYTVTPISETVSVVPRNVTLTLSDAKKIYDNSPLLPSLTAYTLSEGAVVIGDSFKLLTVFGSQTEAGSSLFDATYAFYDANGKDISALYNVTLKKGTLTVEPRPVIVTTGSHSLKYDGCEHSYGEDDIESFAVSGNESSGLCTGHEIAVTKNAVFTDVANSGANNIQFEIREGNTPVNPNNYAIDFRPGTVTIEPRNVVICTSSDSFTYDDNYHFYGEEDISAGAIPGDENSGLAYGHKIVVTHSSQFKNVSDSGANDIQFEIIDENTKKTIDKNNYVIDPVLGTVTVSPISITLGSPDRLIKYDGFEHFGVNYDYEIEVKDGYLVPGHYITVTEKTVFKNVVSDLDNAFKVDIFGNDLKPATDNYAIEYDCGKITVTPPTLIVNMASGTFLYDGTFISLGYESLDGLAYGHSFIPTVTCEKNAGEYVNTVLDFDILDENLNSVKDNYTDVTVNPGTLTITKRKVMFVTGSAEKIYDATFLDAKTLNCYEGYPDGSYHALAEGHHTQTKGSYTAIVDAGTVENVFTGDIFILDAKGNDETMNYIIETENGTLTIYKREIWVETISESFIYDGKDHSYGTESSHAWVTSTSPYQLCKNHYLSITTTTTFKNVAYYESETINNLEVIVVNDVITQNYNIIPYYGKVTVLPRPITITTGDHSFVYSDLGFVFGDGDIFAEPYNPNGSGLCETHSLHVTGTSKTFTEVKDSGDNVIPYEIREGNTVIDKHNYKITDDYGTVTVIPRPITITTRGDSFVYDGKAHEYGEGYISAEEYDKTGERGLCAGHSFHVTKIAVFSQVKDSGSLGAYAKASNSSAGKIGFEIRRGQTIIDADNYEIVENYGKITVNPRPIKISTVSDSFTYDGKKHEYGTVGVDIFFESYDGVNNRGLCENHEPRIVKKSSFINVSDSGPNVIDFEIRNKLNSIQIDISNYKLATDYKDVTVKKRPLTITTSSDSFIYDGQWHEYGINDIFAEEYNPAGTGLCEGHYISVPTNTKYKNVAESGDLEINFEIRDRNAPSSQSIIDKNNYEIKENFGTLEISKRPITLTSQSYEGTYSGKINLNGITVSTTEGMGLCMGHTLVPEDKFYDDIVYDVENDVAFDILDADLVTAKDNYEINYIKGRVTIHPIKITVITDSKSWKYDGLEHSSPNYKITSESELLLENHRLIVVSGTTIREVGSLANTLEFMVVDSASFDDVSKFYEIIQEKGTLSIYKNGGVIVGPPAFPENPGIGLPEGEEEGDPAIVFVIKSESTGLVYLKQGSYGNYTGQGWLSAKEYDKLIQGYASAYYLNSMAASNANLSASSILIDSKLGIYALPYYAIAKGEVQTSDVIMSGDASAPYTVLYYPELDGAVLNDSLSKYEEAYRDFVYTNYLTIDDDTRKHMDGIIAEEGFTSDDIEAVAKYIQNAATYDLKYDRALDSENNVVVAFLDEYKTGICQHYASAATMLYRALGIPARYTVGYVGNAQAGIESEITSDMAHAWVEIYLDGIGWIQVEVTGAGAGGAFGNGQNGGEKEEEPYLAYSTVTVRPASQAKEYDSYPLYPKNEVDRSDEILRQLLAYGYSYEIKTSGSQTEIGVGTSYVDMFKIYDHQGNDITGYYDIRYETSTLHVSYYVIELYLYENIYEYSSSSYKLNDNEYFETKISDNLVLEEVSINISLTDAGWISSEDINRNPAAYLSYRVLTKSGEDVTDKCAVRVASYQ